MISVNFIKKISKTTIIIDGPSCLNIWADLSAARVFWYPYHSFLANNLRFMVKLIVKTIVINGRIHKNKRKRFYSRNKEGLIC
jgi:hypothetical protein